MSDPEAIAVIGMACRFPGAPDVRAYWNLLRTGRIGVSRFGPEALAAAGVDPRIVSDPRYVPVRGVLDGSAEFDWAFFRYTQSEAVAIDPQQRVFLECAATAIDDAGLDPARFPGWIGVYAGSDYSVAPPDPDLDPLTLVIGRDKDYLATRVAYKMGLRGPAITVQTACSTSLAAVHVAAQSLMAYECDAALAGGVSVGAPWQRGYLYHEGGILSPDGRCRPFDAEAAGTVPGEGVGVVVLRRLVDALRDGDQITAVIAGSAINNDGAEKVGYTAPSVSGQRDVIRMAQHLADVSPAEVHYVEGHGTGTRLGDPVEVQALTDVFSAAERREPCLLGSVKGNIGHTGAAAGAASLIKTALMLHHRELVGTAHFQRPNPLLQLDETPFLISDAARPWPQDGERCAGVSSFGIGGTNAHVVICAAPTRQRPASARAVRLFAVSAATQKALGQLRTDLAERLTADRSLRLDDVARTLAGRRRFDHRAALVATNRADIIDLLQDAAVAAGQVRPAATAAFLFPGQGTLRNGAGAAAYGLLTTFRTLFDQVRADIGELVDVDTLPVVADGDPDWYLDTVHQQLGLFALGYACGRMLMEWGIEPAALLGNSIGEYTAAALADVWKPADAIRIIHARAVAMRDTPVGRMLAVQADPENLEALLKAHGGEVSVAVENPGGVVLAGAASAVTQLEDSGALSGLDVRQIDSTRAFHSPLMSGARDAVRAAVAGAVSARSRLPVVSNLTGGWTDPDRAGAADYWTDHLMHRVRLDQGLGSLLASDCEVFVELGPGSSMIGSLRRHRSWPATHLTVPLLGRGGDDALLRALGTMWTAGFDVPLEQIYRPGYAVKCALPAHPFARTSPGKVMTATAKAATATAAGATSDRVRSVLAGLWCGALGVTSVADGDDFFALGGESLMAVQLMNRIYLRCGWRIPVADFQAASTFGELVSMVRTADPGATELPDGVVQLGRGGKGAPLFLAADAFGTTVGYRALGSLIGVSRPVYGLESRLRPGTQVERAAADLVEMLKACRPQEPYLLGGWSFGAIVAHEMARQLGADAVRHLVCLDGRVPYTAGRPLRADRRLLASTLSSHVQALTGRGEIGRLVARSPELRTAFLANLRSLWRYRPGPAPTSASLIVAAGTDVTRWQREAERLYHGGARITEVEGDHWSILRPPRVNRIAELIIDALSRAETEPRCSA